MSLLKNLFGGEKPFGPASLPRNPAEDPNMIRLFDPNGREVFMTRQQWWDDVLCGAVEKHWNDPDKLAKVIAQGLQEAFYKEMVKPAEHLAQLDHDTERSAVLLAIAYLKTKRVDDSERVLLQHIRQHGESDVTLTNLAKVYAKRGDDAQTLETLWRALQLDPNQENALGWYEAIQRHQGGEEAGREALRRIAAIPNSWRAQSWLAQFELRASNLDGALALYRECIARAGKPLPADLLARISGDLGSTGHLFDILELVEPQFDPAVHGLQVGNNLIKAHLQLGQLDDAYRILNQLYMHKRPDWKASLDYWDAEIAKARRR